MELDRFFGCISTTYVKKQHESPGCVASLGVECLTNLETVYKISQDPNIISIYGRASLSSY